MKWAEKLLKVLWPLMKYDIIKVLDIYRIPNQCGGCVIPQNLIWTNCWFTWSSPRRSSYCILYRGRAWEREKMGKERSTKLLEYFSDNQQYIKMLAIYCMSFFRSTFVRTRLLVFLNQELSTKSAIPMLKCTTSQFRKNELLEGYVTLD